MQYLVIAYDYDGALEKRLACREEHIQKAQELMKSGNIINAAALIEDDKMVGSTLMVDFKNDEELETWLENEPYIIGKVWNYEEIQIVPIKLLPKIN